MPVYTKQMLKLLKELWPEEQERLAREKAEKERLRKEREERERLQRELKDPVKVREELNNRRVIKWKATFIDVTSLPAPEVVQWEEGLDRKGWAVLRIHHRGDGELSECYIGKWKDAEKQVACKVLRYKEAVMKYKITNADRQLKLLNNLSHSKLIRMIKIFEIAQTNKINIFMQLAEKGSVADLLYKTRKPVEEAMAKRWARDCGEGLAYLHSIGIAHRRVTGKNVLIDEQDNAKLSCPELLYELCDAKGAIQKCTVPGSRGYHWAPEVNVGPYDPLQADVWSFGVFVHFMLITKAPFLKYYSFNNVKEELENKRWTTAVTGNGFKLTENQVKFLERIFVLDVIVRVAIDEALALPWLAIN